MIGWLTSFVIDVSIKYQKQEYVLMVNITWTGQLYGYGLSQLQSAALEGYVNNITDFAFCVA